MNLIFKMSIFALIWLSIGCNNAQTQNPSTKKVLTAKEFSDAISGKTTLQLVDVRTPEEFANGHIQNAQNFNVNGSEFMTQLSTLDKSKPVYVYCLSGGRSSAAAQKIISAGFSEVYELEGGMMKWRAAGLPETTEQTNPKSGMTLQEFEALLQTDKKVLVDFYADWCKPCQKMEPYLNEIANEQADSVVVLRINADENPDLCKELGVDALPVLKIYQEGTETWTHTGFIEKEQVVTRL